MTEPIKYDPRIHVIVPRVATDKMISEGQEYAYHEMKQHALGCYAAMIAAAPPITIEAPLPVTKAEAVEALDWFNFVVSTHFLGYKKEEKPMKCAIRHLLEAAAQQGE